ncbi:hypothetical protein FHS82_000953 [Pseudochelatococcus lubricantis]|uniref:Flagellar protein FlgJ N-terminal domain-containing protein n=1 Tax=Pseudochelatococcus lubricantis TaxID=1538102 RepID=A0ABX0UVZ1_9HYPH|nr:rod-binding protein [Pseudochelatococcus lubricantis]NIJ57127.1 hypothetical protein [Pseudochelatococcus lubricantis]
MAVSIPADIVMDVARAADPARFRVAVDKLGGADYAQVAGEVALAFSAGEEESAVTTARRDGFGLPLDVERARLGGRDGLPGVNRLRAGDIYQQFEAVTLQTFVEALLPRESTAWFGKGFAGDMWKSLLARQMAEELARSGGIGIARAVRRAHPDGAA